MTTTTHPTTATPAHEHLPIEQIRILEGANARSTMHPDKLDELVASVTASGVLQPVIVQRTSNAQQPFVLIAGHRRVEASRRASRATIPALIYDALNAAEQMQIALVENLQREDLNAIDEARGYQQAIQHANLTQSKLAELTGKSASHISQRLALLKLPDACQGYIASGEVPLPASKSLAHIATVSTQIADTCAKLLVDGHVEPHELIEQPHVVIEVIANDLDDDDAPFVHGVDWHGPIRFRGALTEEQVDELRQRAQAVQMRRFVFTSDDVDAARSSGCLLEFEHQFGSHRFLTDPEWTHDRLCKQLDEREAAAAAARTDDVRSAEHDAGAATAAKTSGDAQGDGDKSSVTQRLERLKREQDERRAQRAADQAKRDAAITANRQLGTTLERKLGAKKVDRDTARLLAEYVLRQNNRMAARGIRYTHPEYHQLEHTRNKSNGATRTRFTVIEPHEAHDKALEWVLKPSQPEVIIGRLLQLIVAGTFADQDAVAQTHRVTWDRPGFMTQTAKLATKLLPEHFHAAAKRMLPEPKKPSTTAKSAKTTAKSKPASKAATKPKAKKAKAGTSARKPANSKPTSSKAATSKKPAASKASSTSKPKAPRTGASNAA